MPEGTIAKEMRGRILTAPIFRTLVRLAWPVMISMSLHTFFNIVNAFWVGRLGPASLAAVTTSLFATWSLWSIAEMVGVGLVAVVARHVGAGDRQRADHVAAQGILLACILSVLIVSLALTVPSLLFRLVRTEADVRTNGILFLRTIMLGSAAFFLLFTLEAILRAWGDTRTPMRIACAVVGLNIVLDPLLIFGPGPFPRLEVLGAAIATVIAHSIGVVLFLRHFHRHRSQFPGIPREILRIDPRTMLSLIRIGAPSSVNAILFSVVYLFLSREAAAIGTGPLAALGIANRVESISYLTASAVAVAAATMVGQNLGAGMRDRVVRTASIATWTGIAVCSFWGICFFALAEPIVRIFSRDPSVIVPGVVLLRLIAVCQSFMGIEIALLGAFRGAGYTLPPMLISSSISVLRIPLARYATVSLHGGIAGIGWVISLTCAFRALCILALLRLGRWSQAVRKA